MNARALRKIVVALCLFAVVALVAAVPTPARAFGDAGAFDARVLLTGSQPAAARPSAPGRWAWELMQRTSAPARAKSQPVRASDPNLSDAPFLYWSGDTAVAPLTGAEIAGLRRFFALGGILLVDDAAPAEAGPGPFGLSARRELARALPDSAPIKIGTEHVVFKTFYLIRRGEARVLGTKHLEAILRGGTTQVIFSDHDLGGALAQSATGSFEHAVVPGGDAQRERATRLAVNIAMYVLCSNYKDDQVHAQFLMRRRAAPAAEP
ncbi:MAG: DUF4159 domain-containing protein [Myxococcales bacterium]|nr:DUF4159 domain-containing protein [Myxococcales bacterium]